MKNPIEFYEAYSAAPSQEEQAKSILSLVDDLPTKKDFILLDNKIDSSVRFLDQKIDMLRSEVYKSINALSNVMYAGFAVTFAGLAYLIFKI